MAFYLLRVCVSDLGSQIFCRRFQWRQRGKYLLRFQEIAAKKPLGRWRLNTIVARRSSALLTAPSIAKKSFLAVYRTICSQFGAKFKAKKCQVSGNYVKKKWTALPKRKADDISTEHEDAYQWMQSCTRRCRYGNYCNN